MAQPQQRDVLYDGLFTFGFRILNVVCAAALGILTARMLGPTGKGLYTLPMVQAAIVVSLFAGLNSATSYFLLNRNSGRSVLVPALVTALLFFAGASAGVLIIAAIGSQWWAALPAILSLPSYIAINFCTGYVIGVKRVRYATSITMATTVVTLVLMAIGMFLVAKSASVAIVVWIVANSAVGAAALLVVFIHSRRLSRGTPVPVRTYAAFAAKVGAVALVSLLNYRADLYIVALLLKPAYLGMYAVAVSAAESLLIPTQVAALVTSPHVGSFEEPAASRLTARCVRNNLLIALAVCGVLFVCAPYLVRVLYGTAFTPAIPALQILLVGVVALSLGAPLSNYFTLKLGKPEVPMTLAAASAVICIVIAYTTVPHFGLEGAALGSSLAYILGQAGGIVVFKRETGVGLREMLVPTLADAAIYLTLVRNMYTDGRRRLLGLSPTR